MKVTRHTPPRYVTQSLFVRFLRELGRFLIQFSEAVEDPAAAARGEFVSAKDAIAQMGVQVSERTLHGHIHSGWFRPGIEYIAVGAGTERSRYRFNPDACREALAVPPEKRGDRTRRLSA